MSLHSPFAKKWQKLTDFVHRGLLPNGSPNISELMCSYLPFFREQASRIVVIVL